MPLVMRRTFSDLPSPDQPDFVVYSGGLSVGRLYRITAGPQRGRWYWAINGVHAGAGVMRITGRADTLEQAKTALAENWRRWLAWARLRELETRIPHPAPPE